MKPYFEEGGVTLYQGDALSVLRGLPEESVHVVVTSPPYWGLRDYGTAKWEGGDAGCDHIAGMARGDTHRQTPGGRGGSFRGGTVQFTDSCGKCGARRIDAQLGLERTPEEYVARMVEVFREVRRVLRKDGTLWLNLGDSYATTSGGGQQVAQTNTGAGLSCNRVGAGKIPGLKPKDLVGIPWRVAFALQADGWYLRSDIIWAKPNPMPESVTDRPTKAHEYLFLLTKSERYYYDAEAIAEPASEVGTVNSFGNKNAAARRVGELTGNMKPGVMYETKPTRNRRSVWTIATEPYPEAHFATFPEALVEPCIKAGCPAAGRRCDCNELIETPTGAISKHGWLTPPTPCDCPIEPAGTVLDPFCGSGTTLSVARRFGCISVGIELNLAYCELATKRLQQSVLELEAVSDGA